jgi:transcriptional antiterminator RfaH
MQDERILIAHDRQTDRIVPTFSQQIPARTQRGNGNVCAAAGESWLSTWRSGVIDSSVNVRMIATMDNVTAWYCARTKPKHEHIAAANLSRNLGLAVFHPRLRFERPTCRGIVRTVEPLFPGYVFVRCDSSAWNDIRYVTGVSSLVHFGQRIVPVPDSVIEELKEYFAAEEPMQVEDLLVPGAEVAVADGAFRGFQATVLRLLPAKQRVQILLDILGRTTLVEVDRRSVSVENRTMADLMPSLALAQ